ncbi:EI24 domain-containing protein [Bacteriovorax sp. Seq25_V]|uniref:EI24 domain-containing protein n=1 Tax=Bacteriovorax sp. Seq25_V TaxID=1201288 RepID=UPI00038A0E77|nr:EI24 domain-containing protein [Bacteriovorax sp. Seq25_V]EQC44736.1 etoposide-induced protein 2.4 [Bacteriovorax sp. Seq25_V]
MFLKVPYLFFKSLDIMKSDKKIIMISVIPVVIGFICYYFLGSYIFGDLFKLGEQYLAEKFQVEGWVSTLLFSLISIMFAVLVNWTFFIFVSVIAAPFNDLISSRVEKIYRPSIETKDSEGFWKGLPKVFKNEAKKVAFVIFLSVINIIIGFIFPPVSFLLGALILAISFIDYSWSRNNLEFGLCFQNMRHGFLSYLLGGILFMFLISIPVLNLFFLPFAVVFFTVIYCELDQKNA